MRQGPLLAVHVGQIEIVWQDCGDAANGRKEPFQKLEKLQKFFNEGHWPRSCIHEVVILIKKCAMLT